MAFQPGKPKTGGRKKGTPNKSSLSLKEQLEERGINPIDYIEAALLDPKIDSLQRANLANDLMGYLFPKRSAVSISQEQEEDLKKLEELKDKPVEELKEIFNKTAKVM